MKNQLLKIAILSTSMLAMSTALQANHLIRCDTLIQQAGKNPMTKVYEVEITESGILVDEELPLEGTGPVNLHIYFNGTYSSINVFHKDSSTYYNADAAIGSDVSFGLYFHSVNDSLFDSVSVFCFATTHPLSTQGIN